MAEPSITFKFEESGYCRVYYTMVSASGRKSLCCMQLAHQGVFEYFECSSDDEPSHIVKPVCAVPKCPGRTLTGKELNAFLDANDKD